MSQIPPLFAADLPIPGTSKVPGMVASDMVMIVGLAVLIFGAFVLYVVLVRGPKNQVPARRIYKRSDEPHSTGKTRKKKKTRLREHRQSNPTLAQTGGLPPPRSPEESPAS